MSIVARWRHPFRQASFIVAVATLAAVSPTSPPSLSGPFMMQAQPTPLAPMPTCPACSPVRRCLCCRPAEHCSGPSSPPSLPLHRCQLVISVYGHMGAPSLFSLSWGQLQAAVSGRRPLGSPLSAELHAAILAPCPRSHVRVSNRSVGALAPLCFLFSVFHNARPPATPRRLGPPLTQR